MSPISNGQDQYIISGLDIGSDTITCVIGQISNSLNDQGIIALAPIPNYNKYDCPPKKAIFLEHLLFIFLSHIPYKFLFQSFDFIFNEQM